MNSYNCLSGCELVTLANTIACIISKNLTTNDIDTLGNFFSAIRLKSLYYCKCSIFLRK